MKRNIKYRLLLTAIASLLFTFLSCSKDNAEDPRIDLSFMEITFSSGANSNTLIVDANTSWKATASDSWCALSQSSGTSGITQIKLTIAQNTTVAARKAVITIVAGSLSKVVTINQTTSDMLIFSQDKFSVANTGGDINFEVQSSASNFTYTLPDWIALKSTFSDTSSPVFTVSKNNAMATRSGYIIYTAGSYKDTVTVQQSGQDATVTADKTGMSTDAMALSVKMGIGWNLGNSLEACSSSTSASETLWGNPKTSKTLIEAVKAGGFKTIRIPCAWSGYIEDQTTYKIKDSWLARVKEVVDYCVESGMYVIINSHWDGGWRDENPYYSTQEATNKKHKAIWQQIAVYFRDYDEHLLFAGTNEVGHSFSTTPTAENIAVQLSFNQVFVDAVRATGGKNTYRNLLVQSYNTNIDYANTYLTMPTDITTNRLMAEIHFYDPWDYCGLKADESWATVKYFWGKEGGYGQYGTLTDWGQEDWVRQKFALLNAKFVSKNIPVVMGEFGPMYKISTSQQAYVDQSRNYYLNYVTKKALQNGIVPVYWDNGRTDNNNSGLFDRNSGAKAHSEAINAIISGGNN